MHKTYTHITTRVWRNEKMKEIDIYIDRYLYFNIYMYGWTYKNKNKNKQTQKKQEEKKIKGSKNVEK